MCRIPPTFGQLCSRDSARIVLFGGPTQSTAANLHGYTDMDNGVLFPSHLAGPKLIRKNCLWKRIMFMVTLLAQVYYGRDKFLLRSYLYPFGVSTLMILN